MSRQVAIALYIVAMLAAIVVVDFCFLKNQIWARLAVNIGIVLLFAVLYLKFFGHP